MALAGVSVIVDGKLTGSRRSPATVNSGAPGGYHLLVIEGYSRTGADVGFVVSRYFTVGGHGWFIRYYPHGSLPDDNGFISLRLFPTNFTTTKDVKAKFEFSFVEDTEKQELFASSSMFSSRMFEKFGGLSKRDYDRFVKRDVLCKSRHFKDDSFTIRCDIVIAEEDVTTSPPFIQVPPSEIKQNLSDLLLSGEGTDVVFRVGGETFAAHRCILAARCAVFKASLFGPMKEGSTTTVVQIDDMDAAVFKALLGFIYGDSLPAPSVEDEQEGSAIFQRLLVAADRYGLQRLMAMCENKLRDLISVSTTPTSILALADTYHCNGLKEACYEFLRCQANLKAVVATDGFDHLCSSCPRVMKDLIVAIRHAQA